MHSGIVLGYHGCSRETAEGILSGKIRHLRCSNSSSEWLGRGVYFWENSYDRALQWATDTLKAKEPTVVGAIINPGHCLDLADSEWLKALKKVSKDFEKRYQEQFGKPVEPNDIARRFHPYDCALINDFCDVWARAGNAPINTVRAAFPEGNPIVNSSFRTLNHIQWAVLTPSESIVGYFRPTQKRGI